MYLFDLPFHYLTSYSVITEYNITNTRIKISQWRNQGATHVNTSPHRQVEVDRSARQNRSFPLHFLISSGTTQEQGRQKVVKKGVKKVCIDVLRCYTAPLQLAVRPGRNKGWISCCCCLPTAVNASAVVSRCRGRHRPDQTVISPSWITDWFGRTE